jgi:hypothetical protein
MRSGSRAAATDSSTSRAGGGAPRWPAAPDAGGLRGGRDPPRPRHDQDGGEAGVPVDFSTGAAPSRASAPSAASSPSSSPARTASRSGGSARRGGRRAAKPASPAACYTTFAAPPSATSCGPACPNASPMQLVGWRSRQMLDRYHIVSHADLREAAGKLDATTGLHGATPRRGARPLPSGWRPRSTTGTGRTRSSATPAAKVVPLRAS